MSPDEVQKKRQAIYRHQSQKDSAMYPGGDRREFWERAEDRNKQTAKLLQHLGLTHYAGVECFVSLKTFDNSQMREFGKN